MKEKILVLCPFGLDLGVLSKAAEMAKVQALVLHSEAETAAQYGAEQIYTLEDSLQITDESAFALCLAKHIAVWQPKIILAPATIKMRNVMSTLAWHLGAGLTADCTGLSMENGKLLQTRPAFGNGLIANILTESPITMATVRPGVFKAAPKPRAAKIEQISITTDFAQVESMGCSPFADGKPLSQAKVIIAGGLGIGSKEGFAQIEAFAQKMGYAVAASRGAVDAGFAPYRCQVGMTGIVVCPKVYIAVGISGAVHHLAGMNGAQTVIAVNSDPKAPIFDYADYGFVGDWKEVIPKLLEELL